MENQAVMAGRMFMHIVHEYATATGRAVAIFVVP